jgi:hypothetical protein
MPTSEKPEPYYPHHEGWVQLPPEHVPRPTYWPAAMAAAIMLILWGLLGSAILTGTGIVLFIVAAAGWLKELRHGGTEHN